MKLSVIVCTRNPRQDYLTRTIEGLEKQSLPTAEWEFLLIDNSSSEPVSSRFDLSWHPNGRHVLEEELGLTPARIRGIKEAQGDLLLFVDDDNVLAENYLEEVLAIAKENPRVGVFGGSCIGEFEQEPAPHIRPYLGHIAIKNVEKVRWGNFVAWGHNMPVGAGMAIHASIAQAYRENLAKDPYLKTLGRKGTSLASCEDADIVITSHSMGYASGVFPELRLTHLIPSFRLKDDYIIRLLREGTASLVILEYIRFQLIPEIRLSFARRVGELLRLSWLRIVDPFQARALKARQQGRIQGYNTVQEVIREKS